MSIVLDTEFETYEKFKHLKCLRQNDDLLDMLLKLENFAEKLYFEYEDLEIEEDNVKRYTWARHTIDDIIDYIFLLCAEAEDDNELRKALTLKDTKENVVYFPEFRGSLPYQKTREDIEYENEQKNQAHYYEDDEYEYDYDDEYGGNYE